MRVVAVALVLLAPLLAGCLAPEPVESASVAGGGLSLPSVPSGATVESIEGGLRLVFDAVEFPFEEEIEIPAGTTLVRVKSDAPGAVPVPLVYNTATGRLRCQPHLVDAWNLDPGETNACAALAVLDPLPATWTVLGLAFGPGGSLLEDAEPVVGRVSVELLATPLDGPASLLDLSQLSMPTMRMLDTEVLRVPSFDGTELHVEVTRPDTTEKVPTILVSSPYNAATRRADMRVEDDVILDWGARGYAVVTADVRGYGESGGCVEVWSENEQRDQAALVEWVAEQEWSDGNVGFYGQSYVATTPVAAAVQAPEALKAIVAVAPVINAYDDWHFGGVPNGENVGSPVGYQQTGMGTTAEDDLQYLENTGNGFCDPTLAARANDPRAVYDAFYEERNFSLRAKDVKAAVLYTQGFEDSNVKSAMIPHWFNALPGPKLGLFGHWVHQHTPRADNELLFLAWMEQYVKGKPMGLEKLAAAYVVTDGTDRAAETWPPLDATPLSLYADLAGGELATEPVDGDATLLLDETGTLVTGPVLLALEGEVEGPVRAAGDLGVRLVGALPLGGNAHVAAFLYEDDALVTWGMFNLAHRDGHDTYVPLAPGETFDVTLPLLPTERVLQPGKTLRLELRASRADDWFAVPPAGGVALTLQGGADGTALVLPTVPVDAPTVGASAEWQFE